MEIKEYLKDDKFFKRTGTKQLQALARNLNIEIKDIKYSNKYRRKLRKRIIDNARSVE